MTKTIAVAMLSSFPTQLSYHHHGTCNNNISNTNPNSALNCLWRGSTLSVGFSSSSVFQKEKCLELIRCPTKWGLVNRRRRHGSDLVRAEMFGQLTTSLEAAWSKLRKQDVLTKENMAEPMRDIRRALLEADVSLPVVRRFVKVVTEQAIGVGVVPGVRSDQQLVKVVSDELVKLMEGEGTVLYYRIDCFSAAQRAEQSRAMAGLPSVGRIRLGSQGLEVSALGLGCMGMSAFYGPPKPDQEMISLIRHAVSRGVSFLDTSDIYGPFTNEILVGKAIKGIREKVQLATKFGVTHDGKPGIRGDPAYVRAACEASLKRLEVDFIDLYYQHRIDTKVPIEVTIGELKKLVEEGKIKYIGLSEASPSTIRRAHAVHPITAVQLEWSLWTRDVEDEIIPTCRELGIGIVPYSPLGGGFLSSGAKLVENLTNNDVRKTMPRLTVENLEKNKVTFAKIAEIASRKGCSPGQLSLAWIFHQGNDISPIPGTTKVENLEENIGSLSVKITPDEMKEIENILSTYSFSGNRLAKQHEQFTWINSETPPLSSWKDSI